MVFVTRSALRHIGFHGRITQRTLWTDRRVIRMSDPFNKEHRRATQVLASGCDGRQFRLTQQKFGDTPPRTAGALPPGYPRNKGLEPPRTARTSAIAKEPPGRF